jgi:pilus assembly protein CpaB
MNWRLLTILSVVCCSCGEPTVVLLASGQDLDEGTELAQGQLLEVRVSRALATQNAVRPDTVTSLLGKRLRIPLKRGDLLLASYFETNPAVSALVAKKARAVTLSVSGAENVHLGDHVDLLAVVHDPQTNEWVSTTQVQNVIVLSPGKLEPVAGDDAFPLRRVTFLLIPEEAEAALLTVRAGGLHLSLRNQDDVDVMEDRGRVTANTVLSGERRRVLEAKRTRVLAESVLTLPRPHQGETTLPKDTAPVPVLPGKQQ